MTDEAFIANEGLLMDSKLRKHSVDMDHGASVAHVKRLLADMSLLPAGFAPKLVYQQRMLGDDECIGSIGYSPERSISVVCVRQHRLQPAPSFTQPLHGRLNPIPLQPLNKPLHVPRQALLQQMHLLQLLTS